MSDSGTSLARMLGILDLFTVARYEWTVEQISDALGYPVSSTYRYVRELTRAGLVARMPGASYVVGAKVIELEALVRHADPIVRAAKPLLRELAQQTGCSALLSNVYGDHLINVAHEEGIEALDLTYLRGTPLPWFRGSPGKAVLAFTPAARARKLFEKFSDEGQRDENGWRKCRADLKRIREAGYSVSIGELDPQAMGVAAPVILESEVIGSISLACSQQRAEVLRTQGLADLLMAKARELGGIVHARALGAKP